MAKRLNEIDATLGRLGVGRTTMYGLLASGELRSVKIGRRRLISDDAIDEYIAKLESQPTRGGAA